MNRKSFRLWFLLLLNFTLLSITTLTGLAQGTEPTFIDGGQVFNPSRAYYPSVLYRNGPNPFGDASGGLIGGGLGSYAADPYYKMWYSTSGGVGFAYSIDGVTWTAAGLVSGLTNPHHVQVLYNAGGFGGGATYKIWYWNTPFLYGGATGCDPSLINHGCSIWYAESNDGITWVNNQPVFGGDGTAASWQRGSYGPVTMIYNASAGNAAANPGCATSTPVTCNPLDYNYVMYYDGTSGGTEDIGLAFSTDGLVWQRWTDVTGVNQPVLPRGVAGAWDATHVAYGTIMPVPGGGGYQMWYSGGDGRVDQGIGYATSPDGIVWTRSPGNPIANVGSTSSTSGDWNFGRNYTPAVIYSATKFDGNVAPGEDCDYKMWRSGREQTSSGIYSVGYACAVIPPPVTLPPATVPPPEPEPAPAFVYSDPAISKDGSPLHATAGEVIIWTITVTNPGTTPTQNFVFVRDSFPPMFDILDVTTTHGNVLTKGPEVQVEIGQLQSGESIDITITTLANAKAQVGEFCNTASADWNYTYTDTACIDLFPAELPQTGGRSFTALLIWLSLPIIVLLATIWVYATRQRNQAL